MKTVFQKLFFLFFLLTTFSHSQDWIKNYPGIPLETGIVWDWVTKTDGTPGNHGAVDSMKLAGIDIVHLSLATPGRMDTITNWNTNGFRVLPFRSTDASGNVYNWIQHYTDAKYSIWEAEGTSLGVEDAGLVQKNTSKTEEYNYGNSTLIRRKANVSNSIDTLTEGPYYDQDVHYYAAQDDSLKTIYYNAKFYLMLENNSPPPIYNPQDTICILQVTYSKQETPYFLKITKVIDSIIIQRGSFEQLGVIDTVSLDYDLVNTDPLALPGYVPETQSSFKDDKSNPGPRDSRGYIQFKVIWNGKSNAQGKPSYLLSFDKVVLSDDRGRELINPTSEAKGRIELQDQKLINYYDDIPGWIGIDEPVSIDIFEPIRIVKNALETETNNQRPLLIPFMGSWFGYWDVSNNIFGAQGKSKWKVFGLRVGTTRIIQNFYLYEYPYRSNTSPCNCTSYRDRNIRVLAEMNYRQAYGLDPNFGASIQCGAVENTQAHQRNVYRHEVLYNANLALMYGAKFIQLWNYFAQTKTSVSTGYTNHGIVDWEPDINHTIYTDKYFMLRDTLNPRLEGLFGQKIKHLIPNFDLDSLGIVVTSSNENVNYIKNITLISAPQDSTPIFDLGFFSDPESPDPSGYEDRYFMLLKRYYPQSLGLQNFSVSFNNMSTYTNWQISDFIDTTYYTITPNSNGEFGSDFFQLFNGDALFYRLAPVVKYGGKLIQNETIDNGTVLYDKMSIENGATLTVNGTYTANANITIKSGGKIKYGSNNSKIIFNNGSKLILEGNAQVFGLSNTNKLTLQYDASTSFGVFVNPGASPIISYCNISGPLNGISVENEATINVTNTSISNCSNTGIALFHFGNGDSFAALTTPNIYKCTISNCGTAISAVNCTEVIIKENTITQCNLGLYFNMVNSAYISSNTILGWQSATGSPMPGISMSSSGGYLRTNTIRYHNYGVQLAYSSPDLGVNTIEYNYKCGVFSDIGSFPNLVQQLANPQCWYPIGGCNVIRNNGTFTQLPPSNPSIQPDGAEIFLNSGDVLLSYGYNEISDDRTGIPTYLTIPLIKGTRSTGGSREFFVDHNYWGTIGPSPSRFGTLEADYYPTAEYCPLPDAPCSGSELIIQTTDGQIVDTLDSRERGSTEISALEENYATADKLFYSGEIEEAKTYYLTIVQGSYTNTEKLYAYNKLYEIGELLKEENSYFTELQNAFNSIIEVETDTLLLKAFNQRSILCDVSKEEYVTAINKFDEIIQQNPNSEEAVYAEIDILTTALNLDTTNTQLGKIAGGKYLVKGTSDYLLKLNDILQSKFGINSEEKGQIIPKEYSLHQNYPNPFNPITTIKFDIPDDGLVQLEIFDILGKRITTLVNEYKSAGSYEHQFNASSLSSGVYIYKLQAGDFVSSKKMLLLK